MDNMGIVIMCLALWSSLFISGCSSVDGGEISLVFTGDVMLDRGVRQQIERKGIDHIFSAVKDSFLAADATVINLECPLTDVEDPQEKQFVFKANEEWATSLKANGITHASLANNHSYDQGRIGMEHTANTLKKNGIIATGVGDSDRERIKPVEISKNGLKTAIFSSVLLPLDKWVQKDGMVGICNADADELAKAITVYKKRNPESKIIVSLHWGIEYMNKPTGKQRRDATLLAKAGADIIIGHHPHVVQQVEEINKCTVIYSLGNFVFDSKREEGQKGQMAKVTFNKKGTRLKLYDVDIKKCRPKIRRH